MALREGADSLLVSSGTDLGHLLAQALQPEPEGVTGRIQEIRYDRPYSALAGSQCTCTWPLTFEILKPTDAL